MSERPLILVSNDDGVHAEGLRELNAALSSWADTVVVAPEREQSATSHRITLAGPLRHTPVSSTVHAVDGSPADCVYVALNLEGLLPRRPDLVVSGINHGLNLGQDVIYSGTVAAAREGALRGVRAVAISAERGAALDAVAAYAMPLIQRLVAVPATPGQPILFNINFPKGPPHGVRATKLGRRDYHDVVEVRTDPRGRSYYWVGGPIVSHDGTLGADTTAVDDGYASITPLSLEMTFPGHMAIAERVAGTQEEPHE